MLYVTQGIKNILSGAEITEIDSDPFEYIKNFIPTIINHDDIEKAKDEEIHYFLSGKLKDGNRNLDFHKSGGISTWGGIFTWVNNLEYKDILVIDIDTVSYSEETFKKHISFVLGEYSYILYPTIQCTKSKLKFRLIIELDGYFNLNEVREATENVCKAARITHDMISYTGVFQSLPAITEKNKDIKPVENVGKKIKMKDLENLRHIKKSFGLDLVKPYQKAIENREFREFKEFMERRRKKEGET